MPKKIESDPLVSSSFVGYVKRVKNERGNLCTKFALAGRGIDSFNSFSKKWYIHDEVCGRRVKKTSHCNSQALFSYEMRRLKISHCNSRTLFTKTLISSETTFNRNVSTETRHPLTSNIFSVQTVLATTKF